jgi:Zn finger protein HypA/HybF involved in hydrogenase expression
MAMTDDERDDAAELASWLPSRKLRARVAELEARLGEMLDVHKRASERSYNLAVRLKAGRDAALAALERVRGVLSANGCYCECECDSDGHDAECERCYGCQVQAALAPPGDGGG